MSETATTQIAQPLSRAEIEPPGFETIAGTNVEHRAAQRSKTRCPRLGFLGVGWIGRHRLEAIAQSGAAEVAGIADASAALAAEAAERVPSAKVASTFEDLVGMGIDGVVIATPSALHAEQAAAALARGVPVFCQKPLGRTAQETRAVIEAARQADLLLGVDLSYRFMSGVRQIHELCRSGELGEIYAVDL
ncbi:MAG TPA: Gfo/Idh/MocA family oxidoreductase, partial [Clostridia bacterium]|nr:Gfo/Idh/MocA family oxidoreductase [Clostridia bacterium]